MPETDDHQHNLTSLPIPSPMCEPQASIKYWTERNQLRGTAVRAARKAAESLVANIRKNRNAPPPILLTSQE